MPVIELITFIYAVPKTCFDQSLDIDLHMKSMKETKEKRLLGRIADKIFLEKYMRKLLQKRNGLIKIEAERNYNLPL